MTDSPKFKEILNILYVNKILNDYKADMAIIPYGLLQIVFPFLNMFAWSLLNETVKCLKLKSVCLPWVPQEWILYQRET